MARILGVCFVLALLAGCGKSSPVQIGAELRYTVRDENGERSSRKRASVLKTIGMTADQIRSWAKDSPAGEDRWMLGEESGGAGVAVVTCRNARASVSSTNSNATTVLQKTDDEIRAWAIDEAGAKERRSATFYLNEHLEIIWRGSAGQLLYTTRDMKGSRTSRDRASAKSTLTMTEDEVRAWAEAESGAAEGRCATFAQDGYVEGISHGLLEDPPWAP